MRSLRQSIAQSWFPGLRELKPILAPALGLSSPLSLTALMRLFDAVETRRFTASIDTDAMHGEAEFIVDSAGNYRFRGSVRATGVPSFAYKVQATLRTAGGAVIVVEASGEVFGLDTPKHSESHWDEGAVSAEIPRFWIDIRSGATFDTNTQKNLIGTLDAIVSVAETVVEVYVAAQFRGLIGAVVVLGLKLGAESGHTFVNPNILAGITVAAGVLVLFGPSAIVPALVAGTGTALLADIRHRTLRRDEIDFARRVFLDKVPYHRILVTDLYNPDSTDAGIPLDREFTFPALDGGIWINMGKNFDQTLGPDANASVRGGSYSTDGQVFIHEMTHAWQIANTNNFTLGCKALTDHNYNFGIERVLRGVPFRAFGPEEQGAIVDKWFGQFTGRLESAEALRDPKFRYIERHIRAGTDV
jgi:hypothetical protein